MKSRRPVPGLGLTLQIALSAVCNCPTTPPAPNSKNIPPSKVEDNPVFRLVAGGLDHGLHGFGALATDQSLNGSDNLIVCRFSTKDEAGYGYCNNQKRSQREKRIVG